jgi:BTB/POZ domain-containing protein 7
VSSSSNDLLSVSPQVSQQLDVVNQTATSSIPAPDATSMEAMQKREQKLRQTPMCQRAMALTLSSKHEIYRQIRLRVVREFNFPDDVSILLENSVSCFCNDDLNKIDAGDDSAADDEIITLPSSPMASNENIPEALAGSSHYTFPRVQQGTPQPTNSTTGSYRRLDLPALVTEGENYNEGEIDVGGHISMIMPDVTASLGQMQIAGSSSATSENIDGLHLDLGDGSSHHIISNQPRATQSQMHLYSGAFMPVAAQTSRLSSSVGNYHHYMTRYMSTTNQPQPSSSSSSQVPAASPYGISASTSSSSQSNRRGGEGGSSFRSSTHSNSSHSSSFL